MKIFFVIVIIANIFLNVANSSLRSSKIFGGVEPPKGIIKYQALLDLRFQMMNYLCGGVLISNNYVLTAAHCVCKEKENSRKKVIVDAVTVKLGGHDRFNSDEFKIYPIGNLHENVIPHEEYYPWDNDVKNDIAIIHIPKLVTSTDHIHPVQVDFSDDKHVGRWAMTMGWGYTSHQSDVESRVLQFINVKVITNKECKKNIGYKIYDTQMCTEGDNGKCVMKGDSGGPLIAEISGEDVLIGISSCISKSSCECVKGYSQYTRINKYKNWIDRHTNNDLHKTPKRWTLFKTKTCCS